MPLARLRPLAVAVLSLALSACPNKDGGEKTAPTASTPAPGPTPAPSPASTGSVATAASSGGAAAPTGPTGTISGMVKFTGKAPEMKEIAPKPADPFCAKATPRENRVVVGKEGGLRDVLVRITVGGAKGVAKDPGPTVNQDGCEFKPRVVGAMPGQVVTYLNGDKTMHNVRLVKGSETIFNSAQPQGAPAIKKPAPAETGVGKIGCSVHPFMTAYLIVTDHPFFTVTLEDGKFELKDVPAGKYKLEAWHSEYGVKTAEVTVEGGKVSDAKFGYDGTEKPAE